MDNPPNNQLGTTQETTVHLRRDLGRSMATAVVVGNVIGSGIFLKPGNIAADGGSFGLIISIWVAGGILCILGALCFAELATMYPRAGGLYVYLRHAYGRPTAFLFGWTEFVLGRPSSIGALTVAFIGSLTLSLNWSPSVVSQLLMAATLIGFMAWVNIVGVIWGGRVQLATTLVKVAFLTLVALVPFILIPWQGWQVDFDNYSSEVLPKSPTLAMQIGAVLLAVMWAYNGWHAVTPLAEEISQPQRTIPFALFGGIGLLIVLYLAANIAYHGVLSMEEMAAAGDHAAEAMLQRIAGPVGRTAMSVVIMCSTFGAINTNLLQAPRITFAMGRDGTFFRGLAAVHANHKTPVVAILVTSVTSFLFIAAVAVGKHLARNVQMTDAHGLKWRIVESLRTDSIFELLTNLVIFSESIFYMLAVLAVIVLRVRQPGQGRPYRSWGYPLVPITFLVAYTWFMAQIYASSPLESRTGIVVVAAGLLVYWIFKRFRATGSA